VTLAFFDESGLLMAPQVRRTWAPRGETPIQRQRTRSRQKVSAAGVVTISPKRRRLGLYVAFYPDQNVTAAVLVDSVCFAGSFAPRACPCASAVLGEVTSELYLDDATPAGCGSRELE
jgi:hypothetical protein